MRLMKDAAERGAALILVPLTIALAKFVRLEALEKRLRGMRRPASRSAYPTMNLAEHFVKGIMK